jgi:hypothetical protein
MFSQNRNQPISVEFRGCFPHAEVAKFMIEIIDFFWYLKKISWIALIGFISGVIVFLLQHGIR